MRNDGRCGPARENGECAEKPDRPREPGTAVTLRATPHSILSKKGLAGPARGPPHDRGRSIRKNSSGGGGHSTTPRPFNKPMCAASRRGKSRKFSRPRSTISLACSTRFPPSSKRIGTEQGSGPFGRWLAKSSMSNVSSAFVHWPLLAETVFSRLLGDTVPTFDLWRKLVLKTRSPF